MGDQSSTPSALMDSVSGDRQLFPLTPGVRRVGRWMKASDRQPFPFQREVWKAICAGRSGLLHSPTGTGKTLAVWLGALASWFDAQDEEQRVPPDIRQSADRADTKTRKRANRRASAPIQVLWVTPLRALAADTLSALKEPIEDLGLSWTVEKRTSDTSSTLKAKQKKRLPSCLITTPESLSILLSYSETHEQLSSVQLVVLDEWHELMGSKRGVQTELCLARLRALNCSLKTWAVSATIGNVGKAMQTALGHLAMRDETDFPSGPDAIHEPVMVRAPSRRKTRIVSLIPKDIERFPWAGHMGLKSIDAVVASIESVRSSLVFTNTRSQAEKWYAAILQAKPDWAGKIGVHHGSLDRKKRDWVERELDAGNLKAVVCTSSLDLGVDFFPVEQVLQIGSPKGVARLMQRAGRSGHFPGGKSQVMCVPTHALELVEIAAAKSSVKAGTIESRMPQIGCLDVLAQHVVTISCGKAFKQEELYREVSRTNAFRGLSPTQWRWVMDFAARGGSSLKAYPDFERINQDEEGFWSIAHEKAAKRHRMTIGTISSDREVLVQYMKGGKLGTIEESFVSKLKPGENFTFAGKTLKLVMMRDMTAWVRRAKGKVTALPRWHGGRMPLSSELSSAVRTQLGLASRGKFDGSEMKAVRPLLELQRCWSAIPDESSLLIEQVKTRDGFHIYVYPFEGRLVHEGLAAILAWRLSRFQPMTFATTVNDYGIELLSRTEPPLADALQNDWFAQENLVQHIEKSMNASELDRRQFRDIARIAGLVFNGFPGQSKTSKQLQASSNMFFDVFREYDSDNLLLEQARNEVLDHQLEYSRLVEALGRIANSKVLIRQPPKPTPLAFPILVDRLRTKMSSEKLEDRIQRLTQQYEKEALRSVRN